MPSLSDDRPVEMVLIGRRCDECGGSGNGCAVCFQEGETFQAIPLADFAAFVEEVAASACACRGSTAS
jgi:hypothetical protein